MIATSGAEKTAGLLGWHQLLTTIMERGLMDKEHNLSRGETNITKLLATMDPQLQAGEFVFCTIPTLKLPDYLLLQPIAICREPEGTTLVLPVDAAQKAKLPVRGVYRQIILMVHSSLEAVGLTAAIATRLAAHGLSANVIAGYYHDHIFVAKDKAEKAVSVLKELAGDQRQL